MRARILALSVAASLAAASACAPAGPEEVVSDDGEEGEDYGPFNPAGKADGFGGPNDPLVFSAACDAGERLVIAAVGDVLLHSGLQKQAYASSQGFISLWGDAVDLLAQADVTYANLEGPTAPGVNSSGSAVADPGKVFDNRTYVLTDGPYPIPSPVARATGELDRVRMLRLSDQDKVNILGLNAARLLGIDTDSGHATERPGLQP